MNDGVWSTGAASGMGEFCRRGPGPFRAVSGGASPVEPVLVSIQALSNRYDDADDRWLDQVSHLFADLRNEVGGVKRQAKPAPGQKGAAETVILALGSAGAFAAAVDVFRAWLGRDRSRRLRIVLTDRQGRRREVEIQGDAVDNRTLREVTETIAQLLPGR